jgi:hypothetical protein
LIDGYHGFTSRDMPGKYFETGHSFSHSLPLVYKHFFTSSVTNKIIVAGHTGLLNNALTMNHITNCNERNSWETNSW